MTDWLLTNSGVWTINDKFILGTGGGIGQYKTSYIISKGEGSFLNGKISARIKIKNWQNVGAGILCRGDSFGSFVALHTAPSDSGSSNVSLRLSVFLSYDFVPVVTLKEEIILDEGYNLFEMEFVSGRIEGSITTTQGKHVLSYVVPHLPMSGFSGIIKLLKADITIRDFRVDKFVLKKEDGKMEIKKYKYDVFISHSSLDKKRVEEVLSVFNSNGITYWVDHEQIKFGDAITSKIEDGLKNSKYILVALSKNLGKSNWCRAEYGPILNKEYSAKSNNRVIPLKLDDCTDDEIPVLLYDKRRAEYKNKEEFDSLISFLKN